MKNKILPLIILLAFVVGCTNINTIQSTSIPVKSTNTAITEPTLDLQATFQANKTQNAFQQATQYANSTQQWYARTLTALVPTRTPTITPTPTPIPPTLSPSLALDYVVELLETNKGCRLPCWWGITPGVTTWQDAKNFFSPFAQNIIENLDNSNGSYSGVAAVFVPVPGYIDFVDRRSNYGFSIEDNVIVAIYDLDTGFSSTFTVSRFLMEYGYPRKPREAWVLVDPRLLSVGGDWEFSVRFLYPDLGIYAEFTDYSAEVDGDVIRGCFSRSATLILWSPMFRNIVYNDIRTDGEYPYPDKLSPEEALGMSREEMFNFLASSDDIPCLESPIELWEIK